jgi:hypothetical protein
MFLLFSCGSNDPKTNEKVEKEKDTTTVAKQEEKPVVVSLTAKESEDLVKSFIKEKKNIYSQYGKPTSYKKCIGDYDGDGVDDGLVTVSFYELGSDYNTPAYFFINAVDRKPVEIASPRKAEFITWIEVQKMKPNAISAKIFLSMDMVNDKILNTVLTMDNNYFVMTPAAIKKMKVIEDDLGFEQELLRQDPELDPDYDSGQ